MRSTNGFPTLKDHILYLLDQEPNLNTNHLAKLTGAKLNTVQKAMNNLKKKGAVESKRHYEHHPYFWRLKESKEMSERLYSHDSSCAEIFVALKSTGIDMVWWGKVQESVKEKKKVFRPDRKFEAFGRTFYIELETGSGYKQREEIIRWKINSYMKLDGWFHVIFVVQAYDVSAQVYGDEILRIASEYGRNSQFLVSPYSSFVIDPLGKRLIHPEMMIFTLSLLPLEFPLASSPEEEYMAATF